MAEELLINPNTVARAYRELEHEGVIELKHGSGAFIRESIVPRAKLMQKAHAVVKSAFDNSSRLISARMRFAGCSKVNWRPAERQETEEDLCMIQWDPSSRSKTCRGGSDPKRRSTTSR